MSKKKVFLQHCRIVADVSGFGFVVTDLVPVKPFL
jgi:hypothetical protein